MPKKREPKSSQPKLQRVTDDSIRTALTKVTMGVLGGTKLDNLDCQSLIKHIVNLENYQQMIQEAMNTHERRN